jgi:hypothetical protein
VGECLAILMTGNCSSILAIICLTHNSFQLSLAFLCKSVEDSVNDHDFDTEHSEYISEDSNIYVQI